MTASLAAAPPAATDIGVEMHGLIAELYPLCRSITGDGVRSTLRRLKREIPLEIHEVPSGTPAFDWTVPPEWNLRDAYIKNSRGERVVDVHASSLHVVSYSTPVRRTMTLAELRPHLHSLPERPDWIPYRTSYYRRDWGFCVSHRVLESLPEGRYDVCIDSTLAPGHLTYGECLLRGERPDEILVSCHVCHPSLANDNLSGVAVAVALARHLAAQPRRYSYRFLFIPGTIGSITWLALHEDRVARIRHGLVLTGVGDRGAPTYKASRRGDAPVDRAARQVLRELGVAHRVEDFSPFGYDERQYCSPGFDLPVGCLMRTPHGTYPEYHTSADDLDFVTPTSLAASYETCLAILGRLDANAVYLNRNPKCEPQLGKRGLYTALRGSALPAAELALLWVLSLSDGGHDLLQVAERSGLPFPAVQQAAEALVAHELLTPLEEGR